MKNRLKIGDWVKADIIGFGFYEVHTIDDFHIQFKCLKLFLKGLDSRGHITCCHRGTDKFTGKKIPLNHYTYYCMKIDKRKSKYSISKILIKRIKELNIADSKFCDDRWNMEKHPLVRAT